MIRKTNADAAPVTKTALEAFIIQALTEAYVSGMKDGVLLAYSQDVGESMPYLQEGAKRGSEQPVQDASQDSRQGGEDD